MAPKKKSRRDRALEKGASLLVSGVGFNPSKISRETRMLAAQKDPAGIERYLPEDYDPYYDNSSMSVPPTKAFTQKMKKLPNQK